MFIAGSLEHRGAVRIARSAIGFGDSHAFEHSRKLRSATLKPPSPFRGRATFRRPPDGSTAWGGDLSVWLPGGTLPLTGPDFTACFAKPTFDALDKFLDRCGADNELLRRLIR